MFDHKAVPDWLYGIMIPVSFLLIGVGIGALGHQYVCFIGAAR